MLVCGVSRGGVGCKQCSSSADCAVWVYELALSLRFYVRFSLRVLFALGF